MTTTAFEHEPGTAMECLSIPITLEKEPGIDEFGRKVSSFFLFMLVNIFLFLSN